MSQQPLFTDRAVENALGSYVKQLQFILGRLKYSASKFTLYLFLKEKYIPHMIELV